MRSLILLCMMIWLPLCTTLYGCGGGGGGDSVEAIPFGQMQPASHGTITGTIYWAANNRSDSDVNDMESADRSLPNNNFDQAQTLPSPAVVGGYVNISGTGAIGRSYRSGDDRDFYSTTLRAGHMVRLMLPSAEGVSMAQVRLRLYDSSRYELSAMVVASGNNDLIIIDEDGDYYIEIQAVAGGTSYRLITDGGDQIITASAPAEFVPGEVLVKLRPEADRRISQTASALAKAAGMRPRGSAGRWTRMRAGDMADSFKGLNIRTTPQANDHLTGDDLLQARRRDTLRLVKALAARPEVESAQPNYIYRAMAFEPNDPLFEYQWHYELIHLPDAWGLTETWGEGELPGSEDVIVAVIDGGILSTHPDLAGKIVSGYDFVSDSENDGDGQPGIDNDPEDPGGDTGYHGTHVAGTIAAAFNNGIGVAGVGGRTRIMPVRALGKDGTTTTEMDLVNAIRWAAGLRVTDSQGAVVPAPVRRADIINMSLGGTGASNFIYEAVREVRQAGVILIAAAGNEAAASASYPAAFAEVVAVSAVDAAAQITPYSNTGSAIALAAPGGDMSADIQPDGYGDGVLSTMGDAAGNAAYGFHQGTSMAAPHVSGVAALMKAANPALTPDDFDALISSGRITTDLGVAGRDDLYGYGLIDALQAVVAAADPPSMSMASASPGSIHMDAVTDATQLSLSYVGATSPTLNAISINTGAEEWLAVLPDSGANDFGRYTVSVNRTGLSGGLHSGTVTFATSTNDIDVPVTMEVLPDPTTDAPTLHLRLLEDSGTEGVMYIVASSTLTPTGGVYRFTFPNIPLDGTYLLVCGSDLNNDHYYGDPGEATGVYPPMGIEPMILASYQTEVHFIAGFSQNNISLASGNAERIMVVEEE